MAATGTASHRVENDSGTLWLSLMFPAKAGNAEQISAAMEVNSILDVLFIDFEVFEILDRFHHITSRLLPIGQAFYCNYFRYQNVSGS